MYKILLAPVFVILNILVIVLFNLNILIAGTVLALCFAMRMYRAVLRLSEYISNSLERFNDFISRLCFIADDVLSKKQNDLKSNS